MSRMHWSGPRKISDRSYRGNKIMCDCGIYGPYKESFACFSCRKVFKQTNRIELPDHLKIPLGEKRVCKCPQCGQEMADMGIHFKAPKMNKVKQWQKVRILYEHGFTFHGCVHCGPGYRPAELRQVEEFIAGAKSKSEGEKLLEKITKRVLKGR
jgi:hypothetical protein